MLGRVSDPKATLAPGKQITKAVSLIEPLGSGGMGAVWLADHLGLKTRVVVKFMLGSLDGSDSARTRFSREAAAAAQVKSPHVVQMLDHGVSDDGVPFIVMEHLEGRDLGEEIEQNGALVPAAVVAIVVQVAKALSKVHAAGLLHRDIKPDNIFLCEGEEDTFVKLLDFGIAKSSRVDQGDGSLDGETKTGQIVGTPFYMSPEQVTAQKKIDHRADLWALGIVAYEAITGQRPYDGPSFGALAVKIATAPAAPPSSVKPDLPPAFDAWFAKACARDPEQRFSSAKEMSDALRAAFDGVVSMPRSNEDSGQRSSRRTPSGDEKRSSTPSFALAATAEDSSTERTRARAEGGRSRLVMIAVAIVLTVAAVGVLFLSIKPQASATGAVPTPSPTLPPPSREPEPPPIVSAPPPPPAVMMDAAPPPTKSAPPPRPALQGVRPAVSRPSPAETRTTAPPPKPTTNEPPDIF
jgi:eukaryotic-like serine/threonine-protein kinase